MSKDDLMIVDLYFDCRDGFTGGLRCWPDGGAPLDQPVKLKQAFDVIRSTVASLQKNG